MDKIEFLQNHENVEIYKLAYNIIGRYFSDDPDEEAQTTGDQTQYAFDNASTGEGGFSF